MAALCARFARPTVTGLGGGAVLFGSVGEGSCVVGMGAALCGVSGKPGSDEDEEEEAAEGDCKDGGESVAEEDATGGERDGEEAGARGRTGDLAGGPP